MAPGCPADADGQGQPCFGDGAPGSPLTRSHRGTGGPGQVRWQNQKPELLVMPWDVPAGAPRRGREQCAQRWAGCVATTCCPLPMSLRRLSLVYLLPWPAPRRPGPSSPELGEGALGTSTLAGPWCWGATDCPSQGAGRSSEHISQILSTWLPAPHLAPAAGRFGCWPSSPVQVSPRPRLKQPHSPWIPLLQRQGTAGP